MDSITLELYRHRFAGVAEEMGVTLRRTGYSPNIKERLDFSCAVFDGEGGLVAQAAHIPVHLGAMPASIAAARRAFPHWSAGDVVILNDPYEGGTHLPDITTISPVFANDGADGTPQGGKPDFFVASRAHHADVGGMTPGSLPLSREIYQEGIIIPPIKLHEAGELNEGVLRLLLRNVRTPDERRGDLAAQRAAQSIGERRLHELVTAHGRGEVLAYAAHLQAYGEQLARAAIAAWPDGAYAFEDVLELVDEETEQPHQGQPLGAAPALVPIRVAARIAGDGVVFDFTGSAPAVQGSLNAVLSVTQAACYYVVRCLIGDEVPVNGGCFAPVRVVAPAGCVVNALPPSAVAGGNVETSQRIVDLILGALAQALPERIPAASQGTMNNLTIGGRQPDGSAYTYYETIAGGMGAAPDGDGLSGAHSHMTNTLNTPIEALEGAFPLRVTRYALRAGSGGAGRFRGGAGIVREYELLAPATVTLLSERHVVAPWGLAGGGTAKCGCTILIHPDGAEEELPSKFTRHLPAGARLRLETPGGGGWGTG